MSNLSVRVMLRLTFLSLGFPWACQTRDHRQDELLLQFAPLPIPHEMTKSARSRAAAFEITGRLKLGGREGNPLSFLAGECSARDHASRWDGKQIMHFAVA